MTKEHFLSARFNNGIALMLGVIVIAYVGSTVTNATWAAQSGFTGLAILGAFY